MWRTEKLMAEWAASIVYWAFMERLLVVFEVVFDL